LHPRTPVDFFYQLVALKREIEEKAWLLSGFFGFFACYLGFLCCDIDVFEPSTDFWITRYGTLIFCCGSGDYC
jgi:hypothetical protein